MKQKKIGVFLAVAWSMVISGGEFAERAASRDTDLLQKILDEHKAMKERMQELEERNKKLQEGYEQLQQEHQALKTDMKHLSKGGAVLRIETALNDLRLSFRGLTVSEQKEYVYTMHKIGFDLDSFSTVLHSIIGTGLERPLSTEEIQSYLQLLQNGLKSPIDIKWDNRTANFFGQHQTLVEDHLRLLNIILTQLKELESDEYIQQKKVQVPIDFYEFIQQATVMYKVIQDINVQYLKKRNQQMVYVKAVGGIALAGIAVGASIAGYKAYKAFQRFDPTEEVKKIVKKALVQQLPPGIAVYFKT